MNNIANFKKNIKIQKGFTIVETLVAIAILMISIAGPLTIAHKGLTAAVYARDQVVASFLAQDAMEYIKNMRDNAMNTDPSNGFDSWVSMMDGHNCIGSPNKCNINTTQNYSVISNEYKMYISNTGYSPDSTEGVLSQFERSFYVTMMREGEYKVIVTVEWTNGTVANVVTLENEMFNIQR